MTDLKSVTKEEFDAFLAAYPRPLVRDVAAMFEPPLVTYNDFALAPKWPESVVASYVAAMGLPPPYDQPAYGWSILDDAAAQDENKTPQTHSASLGKGAKS